MEKAFSSIFLRLKDVKKFVNFLKMYAKSKLKKAKKV